MYSEGLQEESASMTSLTSIYRYTCCVLAVTVQCHVIVVPLNDTIPILNCMYLYIFYR